MFLDVRQWEGGGGGGLYDVVTINFDIHIMNMVCIDITQDREFKCYIRHTHRAGADPGFWKKGGGGGGGRRAKPDPY